MESPENVNIQCDHVLQFLNAFKSQQHDQLDDDKLFYDHLRKCRCCFMQLTEIRGANIIHQWHRRETFMAMTGLYLSSGRNHSNYFCLNCIELLTIFVQMKVAADGMQKVQNRYIEHNRKLFEVAAVKQEVNDGIDDDTQTNDTGNQTYVDNNNIIEAGPHDFEDENITVVIAEFNNDEVATDQTEDIKNPAEMDDELPECSVELDGLDPMIIAYESDNDSTTTLTDDSDSSVQVIVHFFSCDLCGYETDSKDFLAHHIDSRHKNPNKQSGNEFKCPIDGCNKICKSKRSLYQHRYSIHKRDSQDESTCHNCGKVFNNKAALRKHQQIHNKKYKCHICDISFTKKYQLTDHMETYHINSSKFKCTKCSKSFKSQFKLERHRRRTHDEKKFKCGQCNAAFTAPSLLTEHVQVKHEGKRYHCSYSGCSEKFSSRRSAARHLQEAHKLNDDEYEKYYEQIKMR